MSCTAACDLNSAESAATAIWHWHLLPLQPHKITQTKPPLLSLLTPRNINPTARFRECACVFSLQLKKKVETEWADRLISDALWETRPVITTGSSGSGSEQSSSSTSGCSKFSQLLGTMTTEQNVLSQILKSLASFQMSEVLWALFAHRGTIGQAAFTLTPEIKRGIQTSH